MIRWLLSVLCSCYVLAAGDFQRFDLPNGATVLYQGWRTPAAPFPRFPHVLQSGNAIRRIVTADNGAVLVEFDVLVDVLDNHAGFRIHFAPVSGMPFFAKAPEPRDVRPGDHVMVDVLEQAATGKRLFDSIKAGYRDTPMTMLPLSPDVPQVVGAGSVLTLDRPELLNENGRPIANTKERVSGKRVSASAEDGGQEVRFAFSSEPAPGFRLEAVVYARPRAMIIFTDGELVYCLTAAAPIMPQSGPALIWVRKEGNEPPGRHTGVPTAGRTPFDWLSQPYQAPPSQLRIAGRLAISVTP